MSKKIVVQLDTARSFKFGMAAWKYLAKKYGSVNKASSALATLGNKDENGSSDLTGEGLEAIIDFIYAACLHEVENDSDISIRAIENSLDMKTLPNILNKLIQAKDEAGGEEKTKHEKESDPQ